MLKQRKTIFSLTSKTTAHASSISAPSKMDCLAEAWLLLSYIPTDDFGQPNGNPIFMADLEM